MVLIKLTGIFINEMKMNDAFDVERIHYSLFSDSSGTIVTLDDLDIGASKTSAQPRWPTSFYTQFRMLSWRNFKQSKGRILHLYDVCHYLFMAGIASMLFFQISSSADVARDKMGAVCLLFLFIYLSVFMPILTHCSHISVGSQPYLFFMDT
jgi:hypothetical protein